jgi:hypothetical protein
MASAVDMVEVEGEESVVVVRDTVREVRREVQREDLDPHNNDAKSIPRITHTSAEEHVRSNQENVVPGSLERLKYHQQVGTPTVVKGREKEDGIEDDPGSLERLKYHQQVGTPTVIKGREKEDIIEDRRKKEADIALRRRLVEDNRREEELEGMVRRELEVKEAEAMYRQRMAAGTQRMRSNEKK